MASYASIVAVASLLVFASVAVANAEKIENYQLCRKTRCNVTDLMIDPCPEDLENRQCELPQGNNATFAFNYVTKFSIKQPTSKMFASTIMVDLPFKNMNPDACLYTSCPIRANTQQSWSYKLYISERYPKGIYTVKFKLRDGDPKADFRNECCFKFYLKIV